jgi:hypothetical protein
MSAIQFHISHTSRRQFGMSHSAPVILMVGFGFDVAYGVTVTQR